MLVGNRCEVRVFRLAPILGERPTGVAERDTAVRGSCCLFPLTPRIPLPPPRWVREVAGYARAAGLDTATPALTVGVHQEPVRPSLPRCFARHCMIRSSSSRSRSSSFPSSGLDNEVEPRLVGSLADRAGGVVGAGGLAVVQLHVDLPTPSSLSSTEVGDIRVPSPAPRPPRPRLSPPRSGRRSAARPPAACRVAQAADEDGPGRAAGLPAPRSYRTDSGGG